MKKIHFFCLLFFATVAGYAQNNVQVPTQTVPLKVAVFDPVAVGDIEEAILQIIREEISTVLVNRKDYTVLERQLINKVLEENKFQGEGLVDESQVREIGKIMGADYVFISTISPLNDSYYLSCKMIEVTTARIKNQFTGTTKSGVHDITQTTQYVVKNLLGEKVIQQTVNVPNRPMTASTRQSQGSSDSRQPITTTHQNQYVNTGVLTARGIYMYSGNKLIHPRDTKIMLSDYPEASKYYKTALRKRKSGRTLVTFGFIILGAGMITEIGLAGENGEFYGVSVAGALLSIPFIFPGFHKQKTARKYVRRAVDIYNNSNGFVYEPPSPSIEFEAGFLPSGNIGLVMKF